jgi:DNA-binding transcriptional ArsR family regulator
MGEPRFRQLESLLPEDVSVLGLDEHTACIIDFAQGVFTIRGMGMVTLRGQGREKVFEKGKSYALDILRGVDSGGAPQTTPQPAEAPAPETGGPEESFWKKVHRLRDRFEQGLADHAPETVVSALLDLDGEIWKAHQALDNQECITQAREILRDMIALIGPKLRSCPPSVEACLAPLVEALIELRRRFRDEKKWTEADSLRDSLVNAGIVLEDLKEESRWHLK